MAHDNKDSWQAVIMLGRNPCPLYFSYISKGIHFVNSCQGCNLGAPPLPSCVAFQLLATGGAGGICGCMIEKIKTHTAIVATICTSHLRQANPTHKRRLRAWSHPKKRSSSVRWNIYRVSCLYAKLSQPHCTQASWLRLHYEQTWVWYPSSHLTLGMIWNARISQNVSFNNIKV